MDKSDGWGITAQGEQFVESGVWPSWKFFQSVLESGEGVQVVQFGGSQQGLNDGGTNAVFHGVTRCDSAILIWPSYDQSSAPRLGMMQRYGFLVHEWTMPQQAVMSTCMWKHPSTPR